MTCSRYRELLSRYVDNEVTPRQRSELLAHVQHCHGCAAWLARLRQTDVLLKGVPDTHPSDRVRQAIVDTALKGHSPPAEAGQGRRDGIPAGKGSKVTAGGWRVYASGLLLRFELQPERVALGLAAVGIALAGLAYWVNLTNPFWGYDKFGFLYPGESAGASAPATSTPLSAMSSGVGGIGGPVAAPNVVASMPGDGAQDVPSTGPLRVRFDQPMDRASVEGALRIDPPAGGSFSWGADNEILFEPAGDGLVGGITYTVGLTLTARSLAGSAIAQPTTWSFRTRDPFSVALSAEPGSAIAPTQTFTLLFSSPMDKGTTRDEVVLTADGTGTAQGSIPAILSWDPTGKALTVSPTSILPEGKVKLRVGAGARTQAGEMRGSTSEFTYEVSLPTPRLRLLDGKLIVSQAGSPVHVLYEALDTPDSPLSQVDFDIYELPGNRMSEIGQQSRDWPAALPADLVGSLHEAASIRGYAQQKGGVEPAPVSAEMPMLAPGTYLLTASARSRGGLLVDWQLLAVADRSMALIDRDVFWATQPGGKPWPGAEISLYSANGALADKGVSQEAGLWSPTNSQDAAFAVARDLEGHLAAMPLQARLLENPQRSLDAALATDSPAYYPGQRIQFRILLNRDWNEPAGQEATSLTEQEVSVALANPSGAVVSVLTLKPDTAGGVSGMFDLAPDVRPGEYTLRVGLGTSRRDFSVLVNAPSSDTLTVGVLQLATQEAALDAPRSVITCSLGVLNRHGEPAPSAVVTGTLRIIGDPWASTPVTATTGPDGRANIVLPLPAWTAGFNEPGLYIDAQAEWSGNLGSDRAALDLTSPRRLALGLSDMVSPSLNVAAIAQLQSEGPRVRIVTLAPQGGAQATAPDGDILVMAVSPRGERQAWPMIDLNAASGDVTVPLPDRFSGGTLMIFRAGQPTGRQVRLPFHNAHVSLQVAAPEVAAPASALPVTINLLDIEGQGMGGTATIYMRRVSGLQPGQWDPSPVWQPSARVEVSGTTTVSLESPATPGLWAVVAEVADEGGLRAGGQAIVSVSSGPALLLPPSVVTAGDDTALSIVVYNPSSAAFTSAVRADGGQGIDLINSSIQRVEVPAGGWERLDWHIRPRAAGTSALAFAFQQSGGPAPAGAWRLPVHTEASVNKSTTYASGTLSGQQTVGVQVPSSMGSNVHLQIQATTSLLSALLDAATEISGRSDGPGGNVLSWASRISAAPLVASAYRHANLDSPSGLALSGPQRSLALQQIYALQRADGGWSRESDIAAPSNQADTAEVLIALRRQSLSWTESGQDPQPPLDSGVESDALSLLLGKIQSPITEHPTTAQLDARAHSLYALSLYGAVTSGDIRPLLAYASGSGGAELSQAGRAWLALALWQSGDPSDALAVLDRVLAAPAAGPEAAAPALEALITMNGANRRGARGATGQRGGSEATLGSAITSSRLADSQLAMEYVEVLMSARQGATWPPSYEAGAISALSRFAPQEDPAAGRPGIMFNDQYVALGAGLGNPDTFTADISGASLHAGTNWLKLQAPPSRFLYYSLILKAPR